MKKIPQDIVGDIAILKFPFDMKSAEKKKLGARFLKEHKNVETVLEKSGKFKGRLRKLETKFVVGVRKKETVHTESGCKFIFDVDETYFSPRLASHRKETCEEIAKKLKNNFRVLIMFAGVAPWAIILAKILKTKYPKKKVEIISNEINRKANKFGEKNIKLNKLEEYIKIVGGDAKKLPEKLSRKEKGFDVILMPRPNLKETFLRTALKLVGKGGRIYYHGFGSREGVLEEVRGGAGAGAGLKKVGRLKIRKAGEIGVGRFRWLVSFKVVE